MTLFIPWAIFRHILILYRGYSGDVDTTRSGSKHVITLSQMNSVKKFFLPARFCGETCFATRHFKRIPSTTGKKRESIYNGKSMIVVSKPTPFCIDYMYVMKTHVSFYIQRYTAENYALDISLQALMNHNIPSN